MKITNLSQLKKALQPGAAFQIIEHFIRPEHTGEVRVITKAQTNGFYSAVKDDPSNKISKANGGLGSWCDIGKASNWTFAEKCGGIWTATLAGTFEIQVLEKE